MKPQYTKIGHLSKVDNTEDPNFSNANKTYYAIQTIGIDGLNAPLLFTEHEISRATTRAAKNPEDMPAVKRWWNFF